MLGGLPDGDLDELIGEGKAEITCNFCAAVYQFDKDELNELRRRKQRVQN